jgi:hypothetical protein
MPAVKFFVRLDLDQICLFLDGHQLYWAVAKSGAMSIPTWVLCLLAIFFMQLWGKVCLIQADINVGAANRGH